MLLSQCVEALGEVFEARIDVIGERRGGLGRGLAERAELLFEVLLETARRGGLRFGEGVDALGEVVEALGDLLGEGGEPAALGRAGRTIRTMRRRTASTATTSVAMMRASGMVGL